MSTVCVVGIYTAWNYISIFFIFASCYANLQFRFAPWKLDLYWTLPQFVLPNCCTSVCVFIITNTLHGSVYARRRGCNKLVHYGCVWIRSNSVCIVTTAWRTVNRVRFLAQAREFSPLRKLHTDTVIRPASAQRNREQSDHSLSLPIGLHLLARLKMRGSVPPLPSVHLEVLHLAQGTYCYYYYYYYTRVGILILATLL